MASGPIDGWRQGRKTTTVVNHASAPHRAAEVHQAFAPQDQATDVAIVAIAGILEAEAAFEAQAPVLAPAQAQAVRVDGFVEPLDARGPARIATDLFGSFGGSTGGAPEGHSQAKAHHQDQ